MYGNNNNECSPIPKRQLARAPNSLFLANIGLALSLANVLGASLGDM
jgi:hypothetical protein